MKSEQLVDLLKQRLPSKQLEWRFDRKTDKVRLEHKGIGKGMEISLPEIIAKQQTEHNKAIDEVIYTIHETFQAMEKEQMDGFQGQLHIYPVIRSTSFPMNSAAGEAFITKEHTAETRIYYALDLDTTYRLIDESMLERLSLTTQEIQESALFKMAALPTELKKDEVAGNIFYFLNHNDGYDASRILNQAFLKSMATQIEGHMTISVPHQDVMIIGDIRNDTGYDVLAQMTMHFFTTGKVPITSLSFLYDQGKLEPIFIMAKNRIAERKDRKK